MWYQTDVTKYLKSITQTKKTERIYKNKKFNTWNVRYMIDFFFIPSFETRCRYVVYF